MTLVYLALLVVGVVLASWAYVSLPMGTIDFPVPVRARVTHGPYRWLRHPMYLGTTLLVMGMGGLGGGIWTALAVGTLAELVTREWAWREDRR